MKVTFRDSWYRGEGAELEVESAEVELEDDGDQWFVHISGPNDQMVSLPAHELLNTICFSITREILR